MEENVRLICYTYIEGLSRNGPVYFTSVAIFFTNIPGATKRWRWMSCLYRKFVLSVPSNDNLDKFHILWEKVAISLRSWADTESSLTSAAIGVSATEWLWKKEIIKLRFSFLTSHLTQTFLARLICIPLLKTKYKYTFNSITQQHSRPEEYSNEYEFGYTSVVQTLVYRCPANCWKNIKEVVIREWFMSFWSNTYMLLVGI